MRFLPWLLWKEARGTSSSLQRAPNGARMLAGAAETTAGSSCQLREAVAKKAAADAASAGTVDPDAPNVLQAMMKLEQATARAKTANKVALEAEKEKDAAEKAVAELKRQLQPKRARTDADAGDAHEIHAEVDNWDLRDHRREATRVQNRRNVQVGSRDNQQKPRPGKDGFLLHTRLGLVGWIAYWCYGDAALAVVILVALINTLGLTELVSDALGSRKQKEAETNAKIVDLLKNALGHHVMLFFSVSRCAEALCQKTIQLLVSRVLACARARTWIPVKWPRSLGVRLYAF